MARAEQQITDDEQRPAVPQNLQRLRDRAVLSILRHEITSSAHPAHCAVASALASSSFYELVSRFPTVYPVQYQLRALFEFSLMQRTTSRQLTFTGQLLKGDGDACCFEQRSESGPRRRGRLGRPDYRLRQVPTPQPGAAAQGPAG